MLLPREIIPGVVAYFDPRRLKDDPRVQMTGVWLASSLSRRSPSVCVEVGSGYSVWTPITHQHRRERLMIRLRWRHGGGGAWAHDRLYLMDGATVYSGPDGAFIEASEGEFGFTAEVQRPSLNAEGLRAVVAEVGKQRWRRQKIGRAQEETVPT